MPEEKKKNSTQPETASQNEQPETFVAPEPEKRTKKHVAKDLVDRALALRAQWNTNSDHPKGKEAMAFADLLDEAAGLLAR